MANLVRGYRKRRQVQLRYMAVAIGWAFLAAGPDMAYALFCLTWPSSSANPGRSVEYSTLRPNSTQMAELVMAQRQDTREAVQAALRGEEEEWPHGDD